MSTASALLVAMPVLLLAWANGANDVSRGIATLVGSGMTSARRAIAWGTLCTVLGGLTGILWGSLLAANFSSGLLAAHYRPDLAFITGAGLGASGWLAMATALGMPVSTTHALLGGILGAALVAAGLETLHLAALANKAMLPLLLSPLAAIALCWLMLLVSRQAAAWLPRWRPGCCLEEEWRADPFRCADERDAVTPGLRRLLQALHWLSAGATSFARGLNDVPKMAALLILAAAAGALPMPGDPWRAAVVLVTLAMGIGCLWGGWRVTCVLAHRVTRMDPAQAVTANVGTAALVLAASPLGLPVSTTHVATGSLMGIRIADRAVPTEADALKGILLAWIVTLPASAALAALTAWVFRYL